MENNAQEWLKVLSGFGSKTMDQIGFLPFLGLMGISLFSSFLVALLYVRFFKSRSTGSLIYRAFPLLGTSITAIFITIQFSLPLSLGLLGALSIVRFRTPVKEPEEIGFIMLVVATSLCCATFNILFLGIILVIAFVALLGLHFGKRFLDLRQNDGMLIISVPTASYHQLSEKIRSVIDQSLPTKRLDSLVENNGETVLSYNFSNVADLKVLQIQDVLQGLDPGLRTNIYNNNAVI
jgi:hypothetical protein